MGLLQVYLLSRLSPVVLKQADKEGILELGLHMLPLPYPGSQSLRGSQYLCSESPDLFHAIQEGWDPRALQTGGNRELSDATFLLFLIFILSW